MNLDIFNDLIDKLKESDLVQNFIEELSNHLENSKEKEKNNIMNINSIEEKYKLNSEYANKLKIERNKILEEQARNFNNDESLYYVSYKNSFNNNYQIIEFNKINENKSFYITREELPKNISVGKVMRKIDDKYEIDNDITKQIMKKVEDCAEVLANEQNEELKKCREQKVSDLMSELKIGGLTIRNIYVRLYMAYGSEMIFQIDSGKDGTCIRIGGTCDD